MSKTIRVNLTPELLSKLREGKSLSFSIPPCACGIDGIEVGLAPRKSMFDGIFNGFDSLMDGLDDRLGDIFGNKRSSK